jgi:catechol 2,3-dioxygenase-like lactoylglutathione lyase family enzyme
MRLRSVDLVVADAQAAADFLEGAWRLLPAGSVKGRRFFRGSADHPYIYSVAQGAPGVVAITFSAPAPEIDALAARAAKAGAPLERIAALDVPGGGSGLVVRGPEGQTYQFCTETAPAPAIDARDRPVQVTHAVINTLSREASERFAIDVLGFKVSDRTGHMTFVRCDRKHHCLAYAQSREPSLNHVAFEMQDLDAVMRGYGRLREAGFDCVWGPGRHGPGNNVFSYFIAPYGAVVEYTAEVAEAGDDYKVGGPEDWKWPEGRIDHWGISKKDGARISAAEKAFRFLG